MIRNKEIEEKMSTTKDSFRAYTYTLATIEGRWYKAEPYIMEDPFAAYCYARDVIKGRWPEAETFIMKRPKYALYYSRYVIKSKLDYDQYRICNKNNVNELYVGCFFE